MTLEHDLVSGDVFGLAGTFPRPGWVVLDAARDRRFTGELDFETLPQTRVYLDRGTIYLAERVTDPSLGARLVDAGALNAAQLEHGSLRIGDDEHLGRLFERVPSVDRHTVLITAELMTDECIGWLAHQRVDDVEVTPYRHHPSGVHRWDRGIVDLAPGDPLPAPSPTATPVELASPEPLFAPEGFFTDDMIRWDEPSWLDERPPRGEPQGATAAATSPSADPVFGPGPEEPAITLPSPTRVDDAVESDDWIDRLETEGLPEAGADPLAAGAALPPMPVEPADRFEVIWPSGEVDEQFGATDVASIDDRHPDLDRAGPTARVVRTPEAAAAPLGDPDQPTDTTADAVDEADEPAARGAAADEAAADAPMTDDVVLAVRRAVASIETGSLASRTSVPDTEPEQVSTPTELLAPGRVALRSESSEVSQGVAPPPARSVFDDIPVEQPTLPTEVPAPAEPAPSPEPAPSAERQSALRRLIGSLRRR